MTAVDPRDAAQRGAPDSPAAREARALAAGEAVAALVRTMAEIRDRCVWTAGIGHAELVPYLIEESYELVEAIETGTNADVREELGDVLWQAVFHGEVAVREGSGFDLAAVAEALNIKMIGRHPHVFGAERAASVADVERVWTAAKAAEKSERRHPLEGIPAALPALALAEKAQSRLGTPPRPRLADDEEAIGQELWALVARARAAGVDPERALRERVRQAAAGA